MGGGFILGIAEATYNPTLGAVWALMPVPYIVTFFLGEYQVCLYLRVSGPQLCAGCMASVLITPQAPVSCWAPAGPQPPKDSFPVYSFMQV